MSWYAQAGPRSRDLGKFRSYSQPGTAKTTGGQHRDWSYHFIVHQSAGATHRTRYGVSICDPKGHQAVYLRDFSSLDQAAQTAKEWIDTTLSFHLGTAIPRTAGTIPTPPSQASAQLK